MQREPEQFTATTSVGPSAETDPRTLHPDDRPSVTKRWTTSFGFMVLGTNIAWAAPSQLLIANQLAEWAPTQKEDLLALIMALGGGVSIIATPLAGILSDRTTGRFGRRAPWIVFGAIVAATMLVAMGLVGSFVPLLALWLVFQFAIAFSVNAGYAIPPDRVATRQYGYVSGIMGLAYTLALVLGTAIASLMPLTVAYAVTATVLVGLIAQFVLIHPEGRATRVVRARVAPSWAGVKATLGKYPDFSRVFFSRLTITLGNTVALFYLLYFLRDQIGMSNSDSDTGVLVLTLVYAVAVLVTVVWSGRTSDRLRKRKPFVLGAALGVAAACCIMALAHDFWIVVAAALVLGASWGVFTAIDQALINEVLPSAADRGRDIGIMSLAVALPNALAPVIAALSLSLLGGYPGLYLLAAVLSVIGGVVVLTVKGAR